MYVLIGVVMALSALAWRRSRRAGAAGMTAVPPRYRVVPWGEAPRSPSEGGRVARPADPRLAAANTRAAE